MTTILIHAQKGGVGKTTTTLNLGAALLRQGHARAVALVDLDPQHHLSAMLATDASGAVAGEGGLRLCPDLAAARAARADVTVLDTAPGWSAETAALMPAADLVICPLEPDFLGLSGVGRLLERLDALGLSRDRLRLLLCRFNARLSLHVEVRDRLRARFEALLLPVEIRASVRIAEAPGHRRTVFGHAPASTGAADHAALAAIVARLTQTAEEPA